MLGSRRYLLKRLLRRCSQSSRSPSTAPHTCILLPHWPVGAVRFLSITSYSERCPEAASDHPAARRAVVVVCLHCMVGAAATAGVCINWCLLGELG